jgi:benzoyl-CoA reductase/2-hydroxyglutaryl-CoA dehydratase subunit BcrC/BadD/HgdB
MRGDGYGTCSEEGSPVVKETRKIGPEDVLYTCSYVPEEIILAAGFQPRRFLPEGRPADAHVHQNTCEYVKSVLGAGLEGAAAGAAAIIIANSCDAMRRLYDLWTEYVANPPALFLDLPKKMDADSIAFFASELRKLAEGMERELPGTTVGKQDLREAIETCNEVRSLMEEVFRAQRCPKKRIRGTEVMELCLAGTSRTKTEFSAEIRRFLAGLEEADDGGKERRVLLTGGLIGKPDLVAEIENAGGRVVALDTCVGLRHYETPVEEGAPDPMLALAKRYLTKPACSRMQGFEERLQQMKETAEDAGAAGIVCWTVKFCDTCIYDVPMMSTRFTDLGMPLLWIEGDYSRADLGQLKTRIAAFLEMEW